MAGKIYALRVVKGKKAVSVRFLGTVMSQACFHMICVHVDYDDRARYILSDRLAELVLQNFVTTFNFAIYICTRETGVVYTIPQYYFDTIRNGMRSYMVKMLHVFLTGRMKMV